MRMKGKNHYEMDIEVLQKNRTSIIIKTIDRVGLSLYRSFINTATPVTMAAKSHLRNQKPVLLGVSTNDALGASSKNIGLLQNAKNVYFIPMSQDDPAQKPASMVADFSKTVSAMESALEGKQIQPVII